MLKILGIYYLFILDKIHIVIILGKNNFLVKVRTFKEMLEELI